MHREFDSLMSEPRDAVMGEGILTLTAGQETSPFLVIAGAAHIPGIANFLLSKCDVLTIPTLAGVTQSEVDGILVEHAVGR